MNRRDFLKSVIVASIPLGVIPALEFVPTYEIDWWESWQADRDERGFWSIRGTVKGINKLRFLSDMHRSQYRIRIKLASGFVFEGDFRSAKWDNVFDLYTMRLWVENMVRVV